MSAPVQLPTASSEVEFGATAIGGRFEIVRLLGDGSFAMVYEAIDHDLGRRVALKLFTSHAQDELESALREARAMARLNHENVLAVHDIGEHRGTPFLAIEYAEMDLRRWLAAGSRDYASIMHVFGEAGRGLEAAHRAGLVHHDFKPANVLLRENGSAAVGDFGLARHLDTGDSELDQADVDDRSYALGTLRYIAPERLEGLPGDERSDQFSFCVALWEALAGIHPFTGSDAERRLDSICAGPSGTPRAPAHVVRALRRGLSPDAYDRFETMGDLLTAFADPLPCAPARWLRSSARPVLTTAMLVGVFALGVGFSREAPALDASITPTAVLTADAALDRARDAAFDREYKETVKILMHTMPVIRETDADHQRDYLAQLEVLGDLLSGAGAFPQAAIVYAAGINLSTNLGLDPKVFINKRSTAQARAVRLSLTRNK
ncbi:MAG: serine/threonine-protein kinase [Enhygromyxa sp.]